MRAGLDAAGSGDPEQARTQLEAGLALYGGDFLADEPYAEWATAERDRLRQLAARGLRALSDVQEQAGELDAATDTLDRLVAMDPYDLDVQRTLLALCLRRGRRTDAVRRYTALRRRMLGLFGEDLDFTLADVQGPDAERGRILDGVPQTAADDRLESLLAGLNGPPARGGRPRRRAAARPRRRRLGQDARAHPSHRLPVQSDARAPRRDPGHHVHEQGRAGDARARRGAARPRRPRHVGHDLPRGLRAILRAEAPRLGYTRQFTIYDQADSRRLVKRCIDELGVDPKRFTPAALHHQISDAKNKLRDADAYRELVGSYFEQTVADVYELYEQGLHRMNAMDFDDLLGRTVNVLELFPEVRARYSAGVPPRPRRRVPGHEPRPVPAAPAAGGRGAPQPLRRRRPRPVGLRLPRRRHPQHPRLPGRLPGREGRPARAELPLDADDPRRGQRGHHAQPRAHGQDAVDRPRRRATRSRSASSTTSTPRPATSSARSSGSSTRASRGPSSPSSTARTRSPGSSRTRSCAARSATRSSAARSSTSARRSRTRSPTSPSWPTRRTSSPSRAWPTRPSADRPDVALAR